MAGTESLLFNEAYYLSKNVDVANAVNAGVFASGFAHWSQYGRFEGVSRNASPYYNDAAYAANNTDLAENGVTTAAERYQHFLTYGVTEDRNFFSKDVFDPVVYRAANADLVEMSDVELLRHFKAYGMDEGRVASASFDVTAYLNANADLKAYFSTPGAAFAGRTGDAGVRYHYYFFGLAEARPGMTSGPSYTVEPATTTVTEGNGLVFTVKSSVPLSEATTFTYNITGDTNNGSLTASKAEDFATLTGVVTIPAGSTSITFTVTPTNDNTAEGLEGFRISLFNSKLEVVKQSSVVAIQDGISSVSAALTAGIDNLAGNTNNDTFTGTATTLSVFDTIDGGLGTDTLTISGAGNVDATALTGLTVKAIETATFTLSDAASTLTANTTGWTGLTTVNATVGAKATLTLADTNDVTITASAVDVTNSAVSVTGGRNVTITTVNAVTDGGDTTSDIVVSKATGTVNITSTNKLAGAQDGVDIAVTGGTTVNVTNSTTNATNNTTATQGNVTVTGTAATTAVTVTQSAKVTAAADAAGIAAGDVTVTDANAADATKAGTISAVTLATFGAATLDSSALTTVTASGTGTSLSIGRGALTATPTANTLNLNLNGLTTTGAITDTEAAADDGFTTIAITAATGNSTIATLDVADATAITVAGDKNLTITTLTAGALTSIANNGTGGLTISSELATTVAYTGGSGADSVVLGATTKAINLGAGDDTVTVNASALGTGGSINGGDGTGDTIALSVTAAATATSDAKFQGTISNFERLSLTGTDGGTINLANIGGISHVTVGGVTGGLNLNGATTGLTLVANTAATGTITAALGADGSNDSVTVSVAGKAAVTHTALTLTNFENVTFLTDDTATTPTGIAHVITTLTDASAKSITVTGDAGLTLGTGFTGTALTSFNASGVTKGNVSYTTGALTAAATLIGGAGDDTLNAANSTKAVTLTGNAGNDTLTGSSTIASSVSGGVGNDTLTGGKGADTIDGGDGTDTYVGTWEEQDGASTTSGVVINLGATTLTQSDVYTATKAYLSSTTTGIAANTTGHLYNGESATNAVVLDTLTSIENATGTTKADYIVGSAAANSLVGSDGNDTINGGEGNDTLDGGADVDSLLGGAGADSITGGAGADTIDGGAGNDTIVGAADDASIVGGDGIDLLQVGANFTFGTDANLVTVEQVSLTADNLTVSLAGQTEGFTITIATASHKANITGGNAADSITGGDANDTIAGGTGADTLIGGAGTDSITGGDGVDSISGGAGNDTIAGAADDALLEGGADTDTLEIGATFTNISDAQILTIENITLTAAVATDLGKQTEAFTITGHTGNDTITSGSGADSITGGTGADSITAGAGNDTIVGAADDTLLDGGADADVLQVGATFDDTGDGQIANIETITLTATGLTLTLDNQVEAFTINGFATGASTIIGGGGKDTITGGSGADSITGGLGVDSISGGAGNDTIVGAADDALIDGGTDTDTLQIGATFDDASDAQITGVEAISVTVTGLTVSLADQTEAFTVTLGTPGSHTLNITLGSGNDSITGGDTTDTIVGGAGNDTIIGGGGVDSLTGGEGSDVITIGSGQDVVVLTETTAVADTLVFSTAFATGNTNAATITGFSHGAGLDLFDVGFALKHGTLEFAAGTGATATIAASAPVTVADNGTLAANTGVIFLLSGANDQLAGGTNAGNAVANAVTALTSGADFAASNVATGDSFVLVMDDGTNSFVFHYVADGTAATTAAGDLELIAIINGVADAGTFTTGDFI